MEGVFHFPTNTLPDKSEFEFKPHTLMTRSAFDLVSRHKLQRLLAARGLVALHNENITRSAVELVCAIKFDRKNVFTILPNGVNGEVTVIVYPLLHEIIA